MHDTFEIDHELVCLAASNKMKYGEKGTCKLWYISSCFVPGIGKIDSYKGTWL